MKLGLRILSKDYKHIRILFLEAIFAFLLVFLNLGNLDLKHSFGVFDKIGWAKDLGLLIQKKSYESKLLKQIEVTPSLVRENWELGLFYLEFEKNPELAIQYFTKGFENDVTGNFAFQNKIFESHVRMGLELFQLDEMIFKFWENDYNLYSKIWNEKYDKALSYYNIAIGMESSSFNSDPRTAEFFILEGNLRLYANDFANAEESYKTCISIQSDREECFIGLALVKLRNSSNFPDSKYAMDSEAYTLIQRSLETHEKGDNLLSKHSLFEYWVHSPSYRKDQLKRIETLRTELAQKKNDIGLYDYVLGLSYYDQWKESLTPKMLKSFELAAEKEPDSIDYCIEYGFNYAYYEDSVKGTKLLENCKEKFTPTYRLLSYLGDSYLLAGNYEKARQYHLEAENSEVYAEQKDMVVSHQNSYSIGRANLLLGDRNEGIKYLDLACNNGQGLVQACKRLEKEKE
ncbi:hypothetical protein EHQ59_07620 [Leptospira kemamanensis]|uniref:Tetratricopeptide repeat protein n=1 Tax=Leptospira kemamanensis TaxID=2484942 RepID=A0A4V3JQ82_9LEPT|nr:hypothetical protein [Leptospira kemamanensis]TGL54053.1 hypothetical protein EHQ59_07620 [Leptospira kemamanensis]